MSDDDMLPVDCPDCDRVLETRDELLVHVLWAINQDNHRATFGGDDA